MYRYYPLGLLAIFVAFANLYFFRPLGTTGIGLFLGVLYLVVWGILVWKKRPETKRAAFLVAGFIGLLFGLLVFRVSGIVLFLLLVGIIGSLFVGTYFLSADTSSFRSLSELLLLPLRLGFGYLESALGGRSHQKEKDHTTKWHVAGRMLVTLATGLMIAFPIVGLLLILLMHADPIFAQAVSDWWRQIYQKDIWIRVVYSLGLFVALVPIIRLAVKDRFHAPHGFLYSKASPAAIAVTMALVALTLGAFLFVGWPYMFAHVAAETDLSKYGVATYSEYVKKGFAELILSTSLIYSVLWLGLIAVRGSHTDKSKFLFPMQCVVFVEFGVLVLSIMRRVYLYWNFHGLSLTRVYGSFLLIAISGMTITLFLRHIYPKVRWVMVEAIMLVIFLVGVGVFNADQYIATHHPPTVNKEIDYVYLSRLSADGYEGWKMAYAFVQDTLSDVLLQKPSLSAEDRRKVVYAAMALARLTRNDYDLHRRFDTNEQWQSYIREILSFRKSTTEVFLDYLQKERSYLEQTNLNRVAFDRPTFSDGSREERLSKLDEIKLSTIRELALITSSIGVLSQSGTSDQEAKGVWVMSWRVFRDFSTRDLWEAPGMYKLSPQTYLDERAKNIIDKAMDFHITDFWTYQRMKTDMPLSELLALQKKYLQLYYHVRAQPESEQSVQIDISLNAPFVAGW